MANELLDYIYQAKLYGLSGLGGYRRLINVFADGYTTTDGVNIGASSNVVFDNIAGVVGPTLTYGANQSAPANAIGGGTPSAGASSQTADGTLSGANGFISGETWSGISGVTYVGQDFGAGVTKHIRQVVLYQGYNGDASYTITSALVQWSDNGTSWTTVQAISISAALGAQPFALAASGPHRFWRLLANSGPSDAGRWAVIELQMMELSSASNMMLVTTAQTADASVGYAQVLLEIDNLSSPVLNTDLTVDVTCDGGTTWTSAALSSLTAHSQAGRSVLQTVDQLCTAGTSFAARIKTLNNKNIPIYGCAVSVH